MLKSLFALALLQCCLLEISGFSLARNQERFTCPAADGFYGIDGQCTANYYACVGGVAYPQTCPGTNNVFDPLISKCVSYDVASCRNTVTTTTVAPTTTRATTFTASTTTTKGPTNTVITTTPAGPTFTCPTNEGFFPIPGACGPDYYVCVSGSPYVSTCPGESIFDPVTLICTSVEQASCKPEFKCPSPDGFFPVPGTCGNSYYSCVGGTAYLQNCPGTSVFDPATNNCVAEENASCRTTTKATTPTTTPTTTTPTTTTTRTTTTTPTTTTPTTTTTRTTTTTTTPTTTKPPFVCPGTGHYPYPGSCTLYYVCSGSNYIVASCPAGQVFNPSTEYCEDPINVPGCYFDPVQFFQDLQYVGVTGGPSL
ncbi:integumentary mucin C.1-like [Daphnia pulex]|uniref:integumentary mucin C.1-like n=1 Tax=Daphnia pulex TaxID=6669 RepID=UPI001EDF20DA|nr:integumentary mucin C.1-like [Daphnia pulex]